jgi:hypothetical protein
MTAAITHIEEPHGETVGKAAPPTLHPAFEQALRGAATAMTRAQQALRETPAHPHHDIDEPEPLREAAKAVEELRGIMNDWEDIPNGMLDAIDGALHEVRAAIEALRTPEKTPPIVNRAAMHLTNAEMAINDLLDPARIQAKVIDMPGTEDPNVPHIMNDNGGIVPPWMQRKPIQPLTNDGIVPPYMR